jgi:hypothetical protein
LSEKTCSIAEYIAAQINRAIPQMPAVATQPDQTQPDQSPMKGTHARRISIFSALQSCIASCFERD